MCKYIITPEQWVCSSFAREKRCSKSQNASINNSFMTSNNWSSNTNIDPSFKQKIYFARFHFYNTHILKVIKGQDPLEREGVEVSTSKYLPGIYFRSMLVLLEHFLGSWNQGRYTVIINVNNFLCSKSFTNSLLWSYSNWKLG